MCDAPATTLTTVNGATGTMRTRIMVSNPRLARPRVIALRRLPAGFGGHEVVERLVGVDRRLGTHQRGVDQWRVELRHDVWAERRQRARIAGQRLDRRNEAAGAGELLRECSGG